MAAPEILLTEDQRLEFTEIPQNINEYEIAPTEFISNRWSKCLHEKDGSINRNYYEIATLTELKNTIRSRDVSVEGSKNFKDFEEYLLPRDEWNIVKQTNLLWLVN